MPRPAVAASALLAFCLLAAPAAAQERLELTQISDLSVYDAVLPVSRDHGRREPQTGFIAAFGAGVASHGDVGRGPTVAGSLALGLGCHCALLGLKSDLWGSATSGSEDIELEDLRGRHHLVGVAKWGKRRRSGGRLVLDGTLSHSGRQPLRLQTAAFGSGRQVVSTGSAELDITFGNEVFDDDSLAVHVVADGAAVRWLDAGEPATSATRATTAGLRMGISSIIDEREAVRGRIDFVSARVGHTRVEPALSPAAATGEAQGALGLRPGEVRSVSVRTGLSEITMYDREILGTFTGYVGWVWAEADTADRRLDDNHLEFRAATNMKFAGRESINRVSLGVGREPTHSADGKRLIADYRLELSADHETRRLILGARGGVSWLTSTRGGAGPADETLVRYGSQLEGFYKIGGGLEAGAYHAASFEPQTTWDPWAAPRTWNVEAGLLLRWKGGSRPESRRRHGYAYEPL